ncbi:MAG: peptidoglycan recognition family protein [Clostridia bacterium]
MEITKHLSLINFTQGINKENKYIVVHYTGNNGDSAINNAIYFHSDNRGASAHYFVDEDDIVQVVLDENIGWHCGTTGTYKHFECRNANSIGIEMCSRIDGYGKYYIKDEVIEKTQELIRYLMKLHNIPLENVIRHYDVTGKICPAPMVTDEELWEDFMSNIEKNTEQDLSSWAEDGYKYVLENEISDGLNPKDNVTREELWTMLERFSKKI